MNFNRKHKAFKLESQHFTEDGENVTDSLIQRINAIDPGWMVKGAKPVFMDAETKEEFPISSQHITFNKIDIQAMIDSAGKPPELTFYRIMDGIFEAG